jgi:hypothetical protein
VHKRTGDRRLRLGAICAAAADWAIMKLFERLVVRDGWGELNDNQWTVLWSEQLGQL